MVLNAVEAISEQRLEFHFFQIYLAKPAERNDEKEEVTERVVIMLVWGRKI